MSDSAPPILERRMALTHAEFLRSLPNAARGMAVHIEDGLVRLCDPPRLVRIELSPEGRRALGSLVLPQTLVRLSFQGFSDEGLATFLDRFDLAYRRGGG